MTARTLKLTESGNRNRGKKKKKKKHFVNAISFNYIVNMIHGSYQEWTVNCELSKTWMSVTSISELHIRCWNNLENTTNCMEDIKV